MVVNDNERNRGGYSLQKHVTKSAVESALKLASGRQVESYNLLQVNIAPT